MIIPLRLPFRAVALAAALFAAVAAVPLTATAAQAATPICISGAIQYDYQSAEDGTAKPTRTKPLRNAVVELWGAEKSTDTAHALNVVGATSVNDGSYNLCYTPTTTTSLSTVWVKVWAASTGTVWRVLDGGYQYYTMDLPALSNVTGNRNTGTAKPPAATAPVWHIFDTVNLLYWNRANPTSWCWTANENNGACTPLTVRWYPATPAGTGSYDPTDNIIYLTGVNADSEHLILHEASHFLMHRLFNGTWPSSITCSSHSIRYAATDGCAWSEGFATASAAYALGDSRFVYSDGSSQNLVYGDDWGVGDVVEGNVAGSLLDLWRGVDPDWSGTIAALAAQKPLTLSAYFNTARPAANPPLSTGSTALAKLIPHAIDYGPTMVGDGKSHVLTNGGYLVLNRIGGCNGATSANVEITTAVALSWGQQWKIDASSDGTVRISDACYQPLALTVPTAAGGTVTVKAFDPANPYQKWKLTKSNGTVTLINTQTGLALDRTSTSPGDFATTKSPSGSNSQTWAPIR
ncbi:RICIN domain-containing protein [Streptomyces sp. NRRL S-350]|uniref:RICIN domain-containing protein n=1 Tax=Streptomyces sp. NRRL S-350 TaxID=1463902 RepID=UPI00068AEDFF|nr:RICIN domain-containing protein [Streptomyces sp. NRRL S-350]